MRRIAAVLALLAGCSGLEQEFQLRTGVVANGTSECSTGRTQSLDLSQNADFAKYREHIAEAELVWVRVVVTAVNAGNAATLARGTVGFVQGDGGARKLLDYALPVRVGASVTLAPDADAAAALVDRLLAPPHQAVLSIAGTADALPCRFSFDVETNFRFGVGAGAVFAL